MNTLPVWVSEFEEQGQHTKAIFHTDADIVLKQLNVETLREGVNKVCGSISQLLTDVKTVGHFRLQEVTIQVEISAEGGIELIGTSKLGGKGAITLKFVE